MGVVARSCEMGSVQRLLPNLFQWVLTRVKPERDQNSVAERRRNWWLFTRPIPDLREALSLMDRYIAVPRTAKFFTFRFVSSRTVPDTSVVAIASPDALHLGVLSSRVHRAWAMSTGGRLGVGNDPRYQHRETFRPFPFPPCDEPNTSTSIRALGESLDAHRNARQAAHPDVTVTGLYNVLEKLRSGAELTAKDKVIHQNGLISVLKKLHDDLDAAVLDAYGWPHDLTDEQIIERLVKLNAERAAEEKKGLVRWLRPEFQAPGSAAGKAAARKPAQGSMLGETDVDEEGEEAAGPGPWPKRLGEQLLAVRAVLQRGTARTAREVAKGFAGKATKERLEAVADVLDALRALGQAVAVEGGAEKRWAGTARA